MVGAELIVRGLGRPEGLGTGYIVRPTISAYVTNDMRIAREEIFGPVLTILKFRDEDEAASIANDTVFGLMNFAQTQDQARAKRISRKLQSGSVEINGVRCGNGAPFGGMKQSGKCRVGGKWGVEDFQEIKLVPGW